LRRAPDKQHISGPAKEKGELPMINNANFQLSAEQPALLNQKVDEHSEAWGKEDCSESFRFSVVFCFHYFGRDIDLVIADSPNKMNLENGLDGWIKTEV
jgi:hypothetical protein